MIENILLTTILKFLTLFCHHITEILLNVALNTISLTQQPFQCKQITDTNESLSFVKLRMFFSIGEKKTHKTCR
jgi:hypothetical protein